MNGLTDMDWGWWPVVSLRPPKDKDIDNFSGTALVLYLLFGVIGFFILYKCMFAYFWNRRARRA